MFNNNKKITFTFLMKSIYLPFVSIRYIWFVVVVGNRSINYKFYIKKNYLQSKSKYR
jgi:hypothetical protein